MCKIDHASILWQVDHVCMTEGNTKGHMCFCEEDDCNTGTMNRPKNLALVASLGLIFTTGGRTKLASLLVLLLSNPDNCPMHRWSWIVLNVINLSNVILQIVNKFTKCQYVTNLSNVIVNKLSKCEQIVKLSKCDQFVKCHPTNVDSRFLFPTWCFKKCNKNQKWEWSFLIDDHICKNTDLQKPFLQKPFLQNQRLERNASLTLQLK